MLNLLNQQSASSDEIVAVSERRTVLEAKRELDDSRAKLDQLDLLLAPVTTAYLV